MPPDDVITSGKAFDWRPTIAIVLLVLLGVFIWWQWFMTYHLETVQQGVLYRDGNRGIREFKNMVRRIEPKTVVMLVDDEELADPDKPMFQQELAYLDQRDVRVIRIPVPLGGWPSDAAITEFLAVMEQKENQPVVVHCAQGVRRTGMMVAAYQMSVLGYDAQTAEDKMEWFGRKPTSATMAEIRRFIHSYDRESRRLLDRPTTVSAE